MEVTLDRFGRILLPKKLRDHLGLKPGARLRVEATSEEIALHPADADPVLEEDDILLLDQLDYRLLCLLGCGRLAATPLGDLLVLLGSISGGVNAPFPIICVLINALFDAIRDGAQLNVGPCVCHHEEVRDPGQVSQIKDDDVLGASLGRELSAHPRTLL